MSNPLIESRIAEIRRGRAARDVKRAEEAAKHTTEESRESISPNDVLARERHIAACKYWQNVYEQEQQREYHKRRNEAIAEMARLKTEWDGIDTTPTRRGHIVRQYGRLYRKYVPTTTDEMLLAAWEDERRKAALARIFGGTDGTGKV